VSADHPVFETLAGHIEIEFGVNRWVLVSIGSHQAQEQLDSSRQLAGYLQRRGLSEREANEIAMAAWKMRPRDATISSASADESLVSSTGLSSSTVLLVLLGLVVALVLLAVYAATHLAEGAA
jgi:hypothetical protein